MIIITGAAGFIGSNIAKRLNLMGRNDLLLLDNKKKLCDQVEEKLWTKKFLDKKMAFIGISKVLTQAVD